MFSRNDEYTKATKDARINMYEAEEVSVKLWLVNLSLFMLLIVVSYYSYLYFKSQNTMASSTIVMGVTHMNTSDNDLLTELYNIEVDKIAIEPDNLSISNEMQKIIDNTSIKDAGNYAAELNLEIGNKLTFEQRIADELKLIN
jgi:NADH:ubiquinone oxidoreductase subunit 5 (subunit L)/multisubunit Na+/H+ antiporter MnhA subunit